MVDLLLAAGAAPDAGADAGGAKGFVGRCGKDRSSSNHFMTGDNRGGDAME